MKRTSGSSYSVSVIAETTFKKKKKENKILAQSR